MPPYPCRFSSSSGMTTQRYTNEQTQAMLKYGSFAQGEGGPWPSWRAAGDGSLLSPPTISNMETYSEAVYQEVRC